MRSLDYRELMQQEWPRDIILGVPLAPEDSILSRGDRLVIAGEQKSGKSVLVAQLVRGLVLGTDWLGFAVCGGRRRVLYVQAELRPGRLKKRYQPWETWASRASVSIPEGYFYVWSTNGPLYLTGYKDWERLAEKEKREIGPHPLDLLYEEINEIRPDVIVFDPLVCFHDGDEMSGQDLMAFLTLLDDVKNHACPELGGAAIVIVHHFRKQDPKETRKIPLIERFRGSSVLAGWADSLIGIGIGDVPDTKYLEFTLRDTDTQPQRNLKYNYQTKEFDWTDPEDMLRTWIVERLRLSPDRRESTTDMVLALQTATALRINSSTKALEALATLERRKIIRTVVEGTTRWITAEHP